MRANRPLERIATAEAAPVAAARREFVGAHSIGGLAPAATFPGHFVAERKARILRAIPPLCSGGQLNIVARRILL